MEKSICVVIFPKMMKIDHQTNRITVVLTIPTAQKLVMDLLRQVFQGK